MALSKKQIRHLKALAHNKNPVVTIGSNGASTAVIEEVKSALAHHELIKIKLPAIDKAGRQTIADEVCKQSQANFVTMIGRVLIIYLASSDTKIQFPS